MAPARLMPHWAYSHVSSRESVGQVWMIALVTQMIVMLHPIALPLSIAHSRIDRIYILQYYPLPHIQS